MKRTPHKPTSKNNIICLKQKQKKTKNTKLNTVNLKQTIQHTQNNIQ